MRIHQGVIWNYFWQRRSISIAFFFGTEKKKKKITLFHCGSSAPSPRLPPISYLGLINLCSEPTYYCLYTVAAPCSGEQRGFGQGTRNGTGSRSQSALIQDLSADDTGWQEKVGTNSTFCKNKSPVCSAFLLQPV